MKKMWALACLSVLLLSCSGSAPFIEELEWRVLLRDDGEQRYEELALYVRVSDPDGQEDPALLTVEAGNTGLHWRFPREDWINAEGDWWGMPGMIPHAGMRLPDVLYTLRLEDLAGRTVETSFRPSPDRPLPSTVDWPLVDLVDGILSIDDKYSEAQVITRDLESALIEIVPAHDGARIGTDNVMSWEIWIPLDEVSGGYRLGPFYLKSPESEESS